MKTPIKIRPLAPAELKALELARDAIGPMCDLFRMVPQEDWSPASLGSDGEMRRRFFEAEAVFKGLKTLAPADEAKAAPARKPMFAEHEKMKLGDGYSEHDKERIRDITTKLVEGRVLKGELDPDDPEALKAAVKEAGHVARAAYNAALEYVSG